MTLTPEQQAFYATFGYLHLPAALPVAALDQIRVELSSAMEVAYGGVPDAGRHEQAVLTMGSHTPLLARALEQPAFLDAARALYGPDALGIATYGTSHHGDTGWHADCPHAEPQGVKFSCYLGPTTATTGALRVIPGSHRGEFHDEIRALTRSSDDDSQVESTVLPSQPGDVIAFDLRLFHAALGGGADRRVVNLFYYRNPDTPASERLVREQIIEDFEWLHEKNPGETDVFDAGWLLNGSGSVIRQTWIDRFEALGLLGGVSAATTEQAFPEALAGLWRKSVSGATAGRWTVIETSFKRSLGRVRIAAESTELTLLIRPKGDPHPSFRTQDGLAYCYSTLDCSELSPHDFIRLEAVVDQARSGAKLVRDRIVDTG